MSTVASAAVAPSSESPSPAALQFEAISSVTPVSASATPAMTPNTAAPPTGPSSSDAAVLSSTVKSEWRAVDEGRVDGFMDRARQGLHCSLFCGGAKCKHENWDLFKSRADSKPAFEGLNSAWVTDTVVASQRPATSLFAKYNLIAQFKAKRLTGVFNLQEKGEHSSCGPDGIYASSGYSYNGEVDLMPHGVGYYEFPWPDMTAPENDIVLRSVQVMASHIENGGGKVLVHCHAGLGRTGLMIACYLVYAARMPSAAAIKLVRANRPGAVQTSKQSAFVVGFEAHVNKLATMFPMQMGSGASPSSSSSSKASKSSSKGPTVAFTLCSFINQQRAFLHGEDALPYRYIPKHIHLLMCRVLELVRCGAAKGEAGEGAGTAAAAGSSTTSSSAYVGPSAAALLVLDAFSHTEAEDIVLDMGTVAKAREAMNKGVYNYHGGRSSTAPSAHSTSVTSATVPIVTGAAAKPTSSSSAKEAAVETAPFSHAMVSAGDDIVTLTYIIVEWFRRLDEPVLSASAVDEMAALVAKEEAKAGGPPSAGSTLASSASPAFSPSATSPASTCYGGTMGGGGGACCVPAATHFKLIECTFYRHVRHTIACFLSFVQCVALLGGLPLGKRASLVERVFDVLTHNGRAKVGRISDANRKHCIRFLDQWAGTVGSNYFYGGRDGTVAVFADGNAPSEAQMLMGNTGGGPGSTTGLAGADATVGSGVGFASPTDTYRSPLNATVASGRIISAANAASAGARSNYYTPTASPMMQSTMGSTSPSAMGSRPMAAAGDRSAASVDRPDSKLESYEVTADE